MTAFTHNIIYVGSLLAYVFLAFFVFFKNPKAKLNIICTALVLTMILWVFFDLLSVNADSAAGARFWDSMGSFGWCSFFTFFLWFALAFVKKEKTAYYPLLFAPPLFFIYMQWHGVLTIDYIKVEYGWRSVWPKSLLTYIFQLYCVLLPVLALFLYFDFEKNTQLLIEKKQAGIIFITGLITLIASLIADVLLPLFGYKIPIGTGLFLILWASGIIYAITKYRMMSISVSMAANEIISTMPDALFVLDQTHTIKEVNFAACLLTGYAVPELAGKPISNIIQAEAGFEKINDKGMLRDCAGIIRTKQGGQIRINFSASVIRDKNKNVIGVVCIGRDISEMLELQRREKEIAAEGARIETLEEARKELEKKVDERTAELKKSYEEISVKTQALERFQKLTVGRELEMIKLKEEINEMLKRAGLPVKYSTPDKVKKSGVEK